MPHYYAANLDVRLHVSKSGETIENHTSLRGREWQRRIESLPTILEKGSKALLEHDLPCLEENSSLHFLGKDKNIPFRLVVVGRLKDYAAARGVINNKSHSVHPQAENAPQPIEHDNESQRTPSDSSLKLALYDSPRMGVKFTKRSTDDSDDDDNIAANALLVLVRLSSKCFDRSFDGKTIQDLKIDVFYNGELTHSRYIAGRDRSNPSKLIEIFSGRRVDRITEHGWCIENHGRSSAKSKDVRNRKPQSETSSTRNTAAGLPDWKILCKKMIYEADEYAVRPCGSRCPTADYLESLASMSMPTEFTKHGCMVTGVIDVCISLGTGKKFPPEAGYLVRPERLFDPSAQERPTIKRISTLVSSPQVLTPISFSNPQSFPEIKEPQHYKSKALMTAQITKCSKYVRAQVMTEHDGAATSRRPLEHVRRTGENTGKNASTSIPFSVGSPDLIITASSPDEQGFEYLDHVRNIKELPCDVDQDAIPSTIDVHTPASPLYTLTSVRNKTPKPSKISSSSVDRKCRHGGHPGVIPSIDDYQAFQTSLSPLSSNEPGNKRRKVENDPEVVSGSDTRIEKKFIIERRVTMAAQSSLVSLHPMPPSGGSRTNHSTPIRNGGTELLGTGGKVTATTRTIGPDGTVAPTPINVTLEEATKVSDELDVVGRSDPKNVEEKRPRKTERKTEQREKMDPLEVKSAVGYEGYRPLKPGMSDQLSLARWTR